MRLINRYSTTASAMRRSPVDGDSAPSRLGSPDEHVGSISPKAPMTRLARGHLALLIELLALLLLASAPVAQADTMVVALAGSVTDVLDNVRNWLMGILAGLATVFLSIGGVRYVRGGGDPGEIEKAKTAFKSAGWGYGLAALAPLVVEILKGIVGA
jgi:hypothetical protein